MPEIAQRVHEIAARAQSVGRVPSLTLAVVRDGGLLQFEGIGEHPRPDPDTQYRLGSLTKTLTATMVMQLRDEGALALDDQLYRHLPGTPIGGITLRQLLGHASGLQREPDGPWWERATGGDADQLVAGLTPGKLAGPPFRAFHYSNLGYGLLGAVLQRITGESWADLVGKRVLDPLGMTRTSYSPVEPYARGFVVDPLNGTLHEEPRLDAGAMAPAGQLWSTAADLAKWAAHLADPAPRVLSRDTVDEMCAPVTITDLESWTGGYGLGPQLYRVGERIFVGHGGSMPGYVAHLSVHRRSRIGVIAFANAYGMTGTSIKAIGLETLTAVLDAEPARPAPWLPSVTPAADVAELCGRWWFMGREYEIVADGTRLVMSGLAAPAEPWSFEPEGRDRWLGRTGENAGEVLRVLRAADGSVSGLDIATFVFGRDPSHLA